MILVFPGLCIEMAKMTHFISMLGRLSLLVFMFFAFEGAANQG
jgi:hypothetical protein